VEHMKGSIARVVESPPEYSPEVMVDSPRTRRWELARLLWDSREYLWRVGAIGFLASIALAFLIPPRYTAETQLVPPSGSDSSSLTSLVQRATGGSSIPIPLDILGASGQEPFLTAILQSRTVQDDIIDRFNLMKVFHEKYRVDARKTLQKYTEISEDRRLNVITVRYTDTDRKRAADVTQAYADELNKLAAELNTSAAHRERVFIEQRLQNVTKDLTEAEKNLGTFSSKNVTLDVQQEGKAMMESAAMLNGELIAAQTELQSLKAIYADSNVRVRTAMARVEELKRQIKKMGGSSDALQPDEDGQLYPSIRQLPLLGVKYAELYREAKTQETVFTLLTQQYEMAKIREAKELPTVRILDQAQVPERKSSPSRTLVIVLGTLLSLAAGAIWIVAGQKWERAPSDDPRKMLLGEIWEELRTRVPWVNRRVMPWRYRGDDISHRLQRSERERGDDRSSS
jgi:uncharacterized protein involved in exopolysaccharide biosynthesis